MIEERGKNMTETKRKYQSPDDRYCGTAEEIRFLRRLGSHAPQRKWEDQHKRLLAGYRTSMAQRWVWGKIDPYKIEDFLCLLGEKGR